MHLRRGFIAAVAPQGTNVIWTVIYNFCVHHSGLVYPFLHRDPLPNLNHQSHVTYDWGSKGTVFALAREVF
jgi:hypothetical protein